MTYAGSVGPENANVTVGAGRKRSNQSPERISHPITFMVRSRTMPRSVDILEHWRARAAISMADFLVGQRVRQVWHEAAMAGHAVIRLDRPAPGLMWDTAAQQFRVTECRQSLQRMRAYLGELDNSLTIGVVAQGRSLAEAAVGLKAFGGAEHAARRVRLALRLLGAKKWGTEREVIEAVLLA